MKVQVEINCAVCTREWTGKAPLVPVGVGIVRPCFAVDLAKIEFEPRQFGSDLRYPVWDAVSAVVFCPAGYCESYPEPESVQ